MMDEGELQERFRGIGHSLDWIMALDADVA
jgi:hypothetical protein